MNCKFTTGMILTHKQTQLPRICQHTFVSNSLLNREWEEVLILEIRFYRVGGGTRIAGFLLAVMTALLLFVGTAPIAFIRESMQLPLLVESAEAQIRGHSGCSRRCFDICTGP